MNLFEIFIFSLISQVIMHDKYLYLFIYFALNDHQIIEVKNFIKK